MQIMKITLSKIFERYKVQRKVGSGNKILFWDSENEFKYLKKRNGQIIFVSITIVN